MSTLVVFYSTALHCIFWQSLDLATSEIVAGFYFVAEDFNSVPCEHTPHTLPTELPVLSHDD